MGPWQHLLKAREVRASGVQLQPGNKHKQSICHPLLVSGHNATSSKQSTGCLPQLRQSQRDRPTQLPQQVPEGSGSPHHAARPGGPRPPPRPQLRSTQGGPHPHKHRQDIQEAGQVQRSSLIFPQGTRFRPKRHQSSEEHDRQDTSAIGSE